MKNWIAVVMVMLTLVAFAPRPIETATPAIVNPTGYDIKEQSAIMDKLLKQTDTRVNASLELRRNVLKLHPSIYLHLRMILTDYTVDSAVILELYKGEVKLYKGVLK